MMKEGRRIRERLRWPVPIALVVTTAVSIPIGFALNVSALQVVGVIAGTFAVILTLDALGVTKEPLLRPPDPAEVRVKKLVDALTESTEVVAQIEKEVRARGALAERLQADIERHRELLRLNEAEVEAIAQTFRSEVRTEGRRTLLANVLLNAFFFGLGVLVTVLLT